MRPWPLLAVALLVPLAGCFHGVVPAGVPDDVVAAKGWSEGTATSESRALVARVETRSYERSGLTSGYATLLVATVTDVPLVTSGAVSAAADNALQQAKATPDGSVSVDFSKAGQGTVSAKRFVVVKNVNGADVEGQGFRAEFACSDGYVLVVGLGANAQLAIGKTAWQDVLDFASEVTCAGG